VPSKCRVESNEVHRRRGEPSGDLGVAKPTTPRQRRTMTQAQQYVGIYLHRRRSAIEATGSVLFGDVHESELGSGAAVPGYHPSPQETGSRARVITAA